MTEYGGGEVEVTVENGKLLGCRHGSVAAFKGIPYAAAPVGDRRWRPPESASDWVGIRPAKEFGPAPVQKLPPRTKAMWHNNFADRRELVMSEDCLYLNVWTPDPSTLASLPVMVFVHGGGYRFGHGGLDIHDGEALADRGIVVVTFNMRLGALGFLAHPSMTIENELGASGNYGLLDVVALLEWVRDNIAAFGGNPDRVTLVGNSAGAAMITHLMASHRGRGLFHAAVGQSSSGIFRSDGPMHSNEEAQELGIRALGPLAALPADRLRSLAPTAFIETPPLGVVIDGRVVTEDSEQVFVEGRQLAIPLLVGTTTDEGTPYVTEASADHLRALVGTNNRLGEHYSVSDGQEKHSARRFVTDTRFAYPIWKWGLTHRETSQAPTWIYRFDRELPMPSQLTVDTPADGIAGFGVFHTSELAYVFDNLGSRAWGWRESDRTLAQIMADTWVRFVQNFNPNGHGLPEWPQLDNSEDAQSLVFGEPVRVERIQRLDALRALDGLQRPL